MKSKPRKKNETKTIVEEPVAIEISEPVVRRNIDAVKEILVKKHPELADRIKNGDAAFICNRFLQNGENRAGMAMALGFEPVKCSVCSQEIKGEECSHFTTPLNNCRNGLISWLEMESEK